MPPKNSFFLFFFFSNWLRKACLMGGAKGAEPRAPQIDEPADDASG